MAIITSNGTGGGNWSATTSWAGAVVPVSGDKVIIASADTIVLDGSYTAGDSSTANTNNNAAINIHGYLKASRVQNSGLTAVGSIWVNLDTFAELDFGKVGDAIPAAYTATLYLGADSNTGNKTGLYAERAGSTGNNENRCGGYTQGTSTRTNICISSAPVTTTDNTITLTTSSHGWQAGDIVYIPTSKVNNPTDEAQILTVLSTSGANITFTTTFNASKKAGVWVGNMTRNVKVIAHTGLGRILLDRYNQFIFGETEFVDMDGWNYGGFAGSAVQASGDGCHFVGCSGYQATLIPYYQGAFYNGQFYLDDCVFATGTSNYNTSNGQIQTTKNCLIHGQVAMHEVSRVENSWINVSNNGTNIGKFYNCIFTGRITNMAGKVTFTEYNGCDLGFTHGLKSYYNDNMQRISGAFNTISQTLVKNCLIQANFKNFSNNDSYYPLQHNSLSMKYEQIDNNPLDNKYYTNVYTIVGDAVNTINSNLSLKFTPHNHSNANGLVDFHEVKIPCRNNQTINIVGSIKVDATFYNAGIWTAPYVEISGLGITPVIHTATLSASEAWELFDISATNNQVGFDASLTFRIYISRLGNGNTGSVYLAGLPIAPFATQCRHYGYLFNESSLVRAPNTNISITEVQANALSGVTIDFINKTLVYSGTLTASEIYQYTQAQAVANVAEDVPLLTTDGNNYQLNTGWALVLNIGVVGGINLSGNVELSSVFDLLNHNINGVLTFSTAGTYTFTDGIIGEVVNTSGGNVTLNAGGTTTVTTNTGPGITIVIAQKTFTVINVVPGSIVEIYDNEILDFGNNNTLLASTSSSSTSFGYTHNGATNAIRVQVIKTGYVERIEDFILNATDQSLPMTQTLDNNN